LETSLSKLNTEYKKIDGAEDLTKAASALGKTDLKPIIDAQNEYATAVKESKEAAEDLADAEEKQGKIAKQISDKTDAYDSKKRKLEEI
jgi:hypothetical protein